MNQLINDQAVCGTAPATPGVAGFVKNYMKRGQTETQRDRNFDY